MDAKVFQNCDLLHPCCLYEPVDLLFIAVDGEDFTLAEVQFKARDFVVLRYLLEHHDDFVDLVTLQN